MATNEYNKSSAVPKKKKKREWREMTTTMTSMAMALLQHPTHGHPLEPLDMSHETIPIWSCQFCGRKISADAYVCRECDFYYHRVCVEAPPKIESHPLHPDHPLTLDHVQEFECDVCRESFRFYGSSFRCDMRDFYLGISCALSTLSDRGSAWEGTTPELIALPLHPHPLTSFSTRHDFVEDSDCGLCMEHVEGDGYVCLRLHSRFLIHKRCIQVLYYGDGTKAPQVYHNHPLETFVGSSRCAYCESEGSGEFIGCSRCEVFIHRNCVRVPEEIQYPPHSGHTLALFINPTYKCKLPRCRSCSSSSEGELCYRCTSCEFFVHVGCALRVIGYCKEGMRPEMELSWHEHPLILSHRTKSVSECCARCGNEFPGPAYACKVHDCGFLLHEECTRSELKIDHPYHPDHPLTFRRDVVGSLPCCEACCGTIARKIFSCKLCEFYLHDECAARVPTRKHYLHEHKLLRFDDIPSLKCNRCSTGTFSPFFRCVQCNFNLHEKCMELSLVVKHETHVHPLTLRETYVEDDSGEYYGDLCAERRDGRLGVYVCEICKVTWAFQIECVLPELRKVYLKEHNATAIQRLSNEIATREEEVRAAERKLDKMKGELDELRKKHEAFTLE